MVLDQADPELDGLVKIETQESQFDLFIVVTVPGPIKSFG